MRLHLSVVCLMVLPAFFGCDDGAAPYDPCQGVSQNGVCVGENSFKWCEVVAEKKPEIKTKDCLVYESCKIVGVEARCVLKADRCLPGATKCDGAKIGNCNATGNWEFTDCATGCREMAIAAYCDSGIATADYSSKLKYMARDIDTTTMNRWGDPFEVFPAGVLVVSISGDKIVESARTGVGGAFTIKVPSAIKAGDALMFLAARPVTGKSGVGVSLAVGNPKMASEGKNSTNDIAAAKGTIWSWKFDLLATPPDAYLITEENLSGIMRMFDWENQLLTAAEAQWPSVPSLPLAIWMQPNVSWDCGACAWDQDNSIGALVFNRNIVSEMTVVNQQFWSRAVFAHEFGHYVMSVWGVSPMEGGKHCLSSHYPPGLVWSEGWATWYSSEARRSTNIGNIYYDKQEGSFFSLDIEKRTYSGGAKWIRPVPADGILQTMDENEVSAMLWTITSGTLKAGPVYQALSSSRMKTSPFGRGYKTSTWDVGTDGCTPTNIKVTDRSAPMVADMFDAMVCAGATAAQIDEAAEPTKYYPYPSANPICK